jgi:hypothetical protein
MQIALPGGRRFARVDDNPRSAVVALLPEKFIENRKSFGAVRARDN